MAWSPELAVKHEELDRQHAELFRLLEQASAAYQAGGAAEVTRALTAFTEIMMRHTATEEALMEESLFPDRGRHKTAHEVFLADLTQLAAELKSVGPTPQVGDWIRVRLPEWLRFHIAVNDARLGAHLAQRPDGERAGKRRDTRRTS